MVLATVRRTHNLSRVDVKLLFIYNKKKLGGLGCADLFSISDGATGAHAILRDQEERPCRMILQGCGI